MEKSFVVIDKVNSVAFQCYSLFGFVYKNNDYLAYSLSLKEGLCKIFCSRIFSNNGKYSIADIDSMEKNGIYDIVYNLFVKFPASYSKSGDYQIALDNYLNENDINLINNNFDLGEQNLFSNSVFANSTEDYTYFVKSFYDLFLSNSFSSTFNSFDATTPYSSPSSDLFNDSNGLNSYNADTNYTSSNSFANSNFGFDANSVSDSSSRFNFVLSENTAVNNFEPTTNSFTFNDNFNAQYDLNILDQDSSSSGGPSLASNKTKVLKKSAGFASNSYVIIGTICLIVAAIIVGIAIFIVKNL